MGRSTPLSRYATQASRGRAPAAPGMALAALMALAACAGGPTGPMVVPPSTQPSVPTPSDADPGQLADPTDREAQRLALPELAERERRFAAALEADPPVLLREGLRAEAARAQRLALADPRLLEGLTDPATGRPMRAEVMGVRPALPADLGQTAADCSGCYRVEVYNYASNAAFVALVDPTAGSLRGLTVHPAAQPELPPELAELAARIAVTAPEVQAALGYVPGEGEAGMPGVKTALNESECERSRHLCVAPTFQLGGRALWAIVDLTDGRLVGLRWTDLGRGATARITEQSLQDAVVMARYCQKDNRLTRAGWSLRYRLTPSDGLEVLDLSFEGRPVLASAKLVDWHVSYSGSEGFGYSDATGCPQFSSASVVAFDGPRVEAIEPAAGGGTADAPAADAGGRGFALVQDFRSEQWPLPCNYRYLQRFEFYRDGSFRVGGANVGRGCGNDGTYRPVLRIQPAGRPGLAEWDGAAWRPIETEGYRHEPDAPLDPAGRMLRWTDDAAGGYAMLPNRGQLGDGSRGDAAWVYFSRSRPEEGEADLLTIGPCCNTDHRQGPEKFIEPAPEPLAGSSPVLWHVARMDNDDRPGAAYCWVETRLRDGLIETVEHPCAFGPRFEPIR
ncbi:MAG: hypothetical protein KDH92_09415 [Chloroflexi bacterium]|nr:hypothetical protein [Chloroflexota bacterium]